MIRKESSRRITRSWRFSILAAAVAATPIKSAVADGNDVLTGRIHDIR